MKIRMSNVLNLQGTYDKLKSQVLPLSLAYKLSRFYQAINTNSDFYSSELHKIIDAYAERDPEGNIVYADDNSNIKVQKQYIMKAEEKIQELLHLEVEMPEITFTLKELEDVKLSLEEFNALLPFIREKEKKKEEE